MLRIGLGLGLGLGLGCNDAGAPITSRAGEVHLHQYTSGAHLSVLYVDPPTPLAQTEFDSSLPSVNAPIYDRGGCRVFQIASCGASCPAPGLIDGGPIEMLGLQRPVDLAFDKRLGGYTDLVVERDGGFLVGGTRATVRAQGGGKIPPWEAEMVQPMPFSPSTTLDAGLSSGLEISWPSSGSDGAGVKILVNVIADSGLSGAITCELEDAAQHFRVPDDALALLPPAPRQVQLEVSRYRLVDVPLGDGRSVVVHGAYAVLSARAE